MGTPTHRLPPALADALAGELMEMLEDCARRRAVCPRKSALARRLGIAPEAVAPLFHRLRDRRQIRWRSVQRGLEHVRVVTIVSNGRTTGLPTRYGELGQSRVTDADLERAKTLLRRRGVIVFDARVTDGRKGRSLVKVDGRNLAPAEVLERAARLGRRP